MQEFNKEQYASLRHRKQKLEQRILLDVEGPDRQTARLLLERVTKKIIEYEKEHGIPVYEDKKSFVQSGNDKYWNKTTSTSISPNIDSYKEDVRTDEELIKDLGTAYLIFGSTYVTYANYHVYKVRLLKQLDKMDAFFRVTAMVYEDDILICKKINIGFWPLKLGDVVVKDMECSNQCDDIVKYGNGCNAYLKKILDEMKRLWNSYSDYPKNELLLGNNRIAGFIGTAKNQNEIQEMLNREERLKIIRRLENELKAAASSLTNRSKMYWVNAYNPFNSLEDFLELSGVVYEVNKHGILIWEDESKQFMQLVGYGPYETNLGPNHYVLFLLPRLY